MMGTSAFHFNYKKRSFPRYEVEPAIYDHIEDPFYTHNAETLMDVCSYVEKNNALVASDFDGVVGFTEKAQMTNFGAVVPHLLGNDLPESDQIKLTFEELAKRMLGKSEAEIMRILKNEFNLPGTVDELVELRGELYYKSITSNGVRANPFTHALYEHVATNYGRKPIIVSNGRHKIQSGLLKHFGCDHLIGSVHTSDTMMTHLDVTKRKPAYFEHLVATHPKVVVIEDSASMAKHVEDKLRTKVVYVKHALNKNVPFHPKSGWVFHCASLEKH